MRNATPCPACGARAIHRFCDVCLPFHHSDPEYGVRYNELLKLCGFGRFHPQKSDLHQFHPVRAPLCAKDGCGRVIWVKPSVNKPGVWVRGSKEWCHACTCNRNDRKRRGLDPDTGKLRRGGRDPNANGYILVRAPASGMASADGYVMQHRLVMADALGRDLERFENVHHINGIKSDNRIENLELWCVTQPSGQRVEDMVAWVVQAYPTEVRRLLHATEVEPLQLRLGETVEAG